MYVRTTIPNRMGGDKPYSEKTTTSDALLTALSDTVVFSPKPERNISVTERWLFKSAIPLKQA